MLGKRFRRTTSMSQLGTGHAAQSLSLTNSSMENQNPPLVATFGLTDVLRSESPVFPIDHVVVSPTGSRKSTSPVVREFNVQEQQFGLPLLPGSGPGNVHPEDASRSTHPVNVELLPNVSNMICCEGLPASKQDVCMRLETENSIKNCIPAPLSLPPPVTQSALSPQSPTEHLRRNGPNYVNHQQIRKENMHQSPLSGFQAAPPKGSQMAEWNRHTEIFYPSPRSSAEGRMEVAAAIPPVNFLYACFLCKRRLGNGRDIFMYRGDRAFCSDECRHHQIEIDERREKCSFTAAKQASTTPAHNHNHNTNGKAVPAETAAAA